MSEIIANLIKTAKGCQMLSAVIRNKIKLGEESWQGLQDIMNSLDPCDIDENPNFRKSARPVVWRLLVALAGTPFEDLTAVAASLDRKAAWLTASSTSKPGTSRRRTVRVRRFIPPFPEQQRQCR